MGANNANPTTLTLGVFISLLVATILPGLALVALMVKRRRMFPLSGRDMSLVFGQSVGLLCSAVFPNLRGIMPLACGVGLVADIALPVLGTTIGIARLWRLGFMFHFAQEKLDKHKRKYEPTSSKRKKPSTWYTDHRHWISPSFMWKCIVPTILVTNVFSALIYALSTDLPAGTVDNMDCPRLDRAYVVSIAFQGILFIMVLALSYKIRKVRDGYFIKEELKLFAVVLVLIIIGNNLSRSTVAYMYSFPVFRLYKSICYVGFVGVILIYPIWRSYAHQRANKKADTNIRALFNVHLVSILTDSAYAEERADFEKMLIKEFSVENMMFFEAARRFEKLVPSKYPCSDDCAKEPSKLEHGTDESDCDDGAREPKKLECISAGDCAKEPDKLEFGTNESDCGHDAGEEVESPSVQTLLPINRNPSRSIFGENFVKCVKEPRVHATKAEAQHVSIEHHAFNALVLYAQFIRKGSPYEVNIFFSTFKAIEDEILAKVDSNVVDAFCASGGMHKPSTDFAVSGPIRTDVFSRAKTEVLLLLEGDTFARWKASRADELKQRACDTSGSHNSFASSIV